MSPNIVIFSQRQPFGVLEFLSGFGIVGLYVSVVFVVGRLVRSSMKGKHMQVAFTEMPSVDALIGLCHAIFLAREHGRLDVEEELCMLILEIYRLPQAIHQWSGSLLDRELMTRQVM